MKGPMTRVLSAAALVALTATMAFAQATTAAQTSTPGTPTEKTQTVSGTVVQVDGNTLAVKMSNGAIRMFTPPPDRKFVVDGKELTLAELQPGTTLKATVKEITTPVVDRTVQTLAGRVWYASGPTVILTLENGQNRMYTIPANSPIRFKDSNGQEMTVFDLRKGMNVTATKVIEAPRTELVTTVAVTGTGPRAAGAAAPTSGAAPAPAAGGGETGAGGVEPRPGDCTGGRRSAEKAAQDGQPSADDWPHRSGVARGWVESHHLTPAYDPVVCSHIGLHPSSEGCRPAVGAHAQVHARVRDEYRSSVAYSSWCQCTWRFCCSSKA